MCTTDGAQKAASAPNFARNSLLLTPYQLSEIAEFQRSDFKRRNNRPGITCNIFAEPSAARTKRCIKTAKSSSLDHRRSRVRKHRAPKGALRRIRVKLRVINDGLGQKAPSAKRCIKTDRAHNPEDVKDCVRKHRAPKGALRLTESLFIEVQLSVSESTERQKVH